MKKIHWCLLIFSLAALIPSANAARTVKESARDIPVAYDVDVVVVGGTSRGVAAAQSAAAKGAKVFLAAHRPYLGEDICGTYRLWLEPGEEPTCDLSRAMFRPNPDQPSQMRLGLPFTYTASRPSSPKHPDRSNKLLTDGKYADAPSQSVQYDGSTSIVADLGAGMEVSDATVLVYQRKGEFVVEAIAVLASDDQENWIPVSTVPNPEPNTRMIEGQGLAFKIPVGKTTRYLRFDVKQADEAQRILLGEIIIHSRVLDALAEEQGRQKQQLITTPMTVKTALDDALLAAKVDFLYGSYVTDVLRDGDNQVAGVVIANRSGRQAVRAKVIIDATDRGIAARIAGAEFTPYPTGKQTFTRIVVGGEPTDGAKDLGIAYVIGTRHKAAQPVYEYTLKLPMRDASWASFARADQEARNRTWHTGQVGAAEMLLQVPPDSLVSRVLDSNKWPVGDPSDLDALRPAKVDFVYVLGGCAEVQREAAAKLMRPLPGLALGRRVGEAAAADAAARKAIDAQTVRVPGTLEPSAMDAQVGEMLKLIRKGDPDAVSSPERSLPVIARYDTVVVGGGTGGGPAGVSAARAGARTLVIEYLHGLGGVGTLGRISKYYHGNRVGFTSEIDQGVVDMAKGRKVDSRGGWNIENKMEWLRSEIAKAGGDVWFQSLGIGSVVQDKTFKGVVVATPHGRGVVLAHTVIDATGNAVIPACAGLETQKITGEHISVQGTGLPPFTPGESYKNSDWTFTDDDDVLDMWRIHVVARKKYQGAFDTGQLIDTRARRRIIGDIIVTPMDIINKRVYPDVVTVSKSNFDNHGFSSHELFMITPPDKAGLTGNVPYRALLPKGYEGILVIGLGMSAHGDAMPVMRMQPDVQNQGYAVGKASAMAAEEGIVVRDINIPTLQRHLVDKDVIPESMIGAKDTYPIGPERMVNAVKSIGKDYSGISLVLTNPEMALPELRTAWRKASTKDAKLRYAHVLGMLYDDTGASSLIEAVRAASWDKGWNFRGMGQFGATTSPLDNLVIALGRTGSRDGLPVILEKLKQLTPQSEFSHCRAVAMALETLRAPEGAQPLADFLQQPGISGHTYLEINNVIERTPGNINDNSSRNVSLRELVLARALYRCGDYQSLGEKILRGYAADLRGHYATHAKAILDEGS